ncbi:MAG: hypothetical protein RIR51_1402 [Bacteroidota bacterium]|jgi:tRNA dimethylallyltransferase
MNKKLIVVAGPTAVGKTAYCVELAKKLGTEIISFDSRQFYKELSIGTAKPSLEEQGGVKHHFIDSHSIHEYFSPGDFEREVLKLINNLFHKQDILIATGGSGLYLKALLEGLDEMPEIDEELRQALNRELETKGINELLQELKESDPEYYEIVDKMNPQRVVRALEVCRSSGRPYSYFRTGSKSDRPFEIQKIVLMREREELYERINLRMEKMLENGLVEEAKANIAYRNQYALKTLGYKEVFGYLDGEYDEQEMIRLLKRNNRRYAKKQITWFKNQDNFQYHHPDELIF